PVLHLIEKTDTGTRVRRKWDAAKTPLARLLASEVLSPARRAELEALHDRTNPRALRRELHAGLDALWLPRPAGQPAAAGAQEVAA
ncbi:MAG: hypothetical protein HY690_19110, partial [Chloroflexi bacterium]|nr:hypothetical protein [Chloroflexota bacterium]